MGQVPSAGRLDGAQARLANVVARLAERWRVPGVAVVLVAGDATATYCHGVTSAEHPQPVDANTLLQIGSVTKTFQATLTVQDVVADRLRRDQPVSSVLPELALADPTAHQRLTIDHLLTHRAGLLGDHLLLHGAARRGQGPLLDGVAALADARQVFPVDEVTSYTNAAYTILGAITCRLAGSDDWAAVLGERVLQPAAMEHTFTTASEAITHRVAAPHIGLEVNHSGGWHPGWELPGWDVPVGGLISCAADLGAWLRAQLAEGAGPAGVVLPAGAARDMWRPRVDWGGNADAVATTWWWQDWGGATAIGHGGQTMGYETDLWFLPEHGVGWAVCTNSLGGGAALYRALRPLLLEALAGVDLPDPKPVPLGNRAVDRVVGSYDLPMFDAHVSAGTSPGTIAIDFTAKPAAGYRWLPDPPPRHEAFFVADDRAVVTRPSSNAGTRLRFGPGEPHPAWLLYGGRAGPRTRTDR